ncbi:hypothetical protein BDA96_01G157300 [Sorghum bicolor]|uniref:Uncharacterized protein n=2 Tax=Sorghum bicolor TaxID=4558 RepID=A0A921RY63_SORBI|nr:hypothetical protein SORBI_3001G150000 [Sorghum bicolor]KAG0548327.1 hypothetical protein BDA96_01G157300 [Sorghum bicolor]
MTIPEHVHEQEVELSSMTCLYIVVVEADQSDDLLGWIGWTLSVLVSKLCWRCMISHLISPVQGKGVKLHLC